MTLSRRRVLMLAAGAAAIPALQLFPGAAFAAAEDVAKMMADFSSRRPARSR